MDLKALRNYFYNYRNKENKKEFVIRIRSDKDFVYYKGIKIFSIEKNKLFLSDNIYNLNDAYIKKYKEVLSDKSSRYKKLEEMAILRNELIDQKCMTINNDLKISYNKSSAGIYEINNQAIVDRDNHLKKILLIIKDELEDYIDIYDNYCIVNKEKINSILDPLNKMVTLLNIEYVVMNTFIYFDDIYWTDEIQGPFVNSQAKNKSGWKKPNIKFVEPNSYDLEKLDRKVLGEIISKVKSAVDKYLKISFEEEKNYQHQFMLDDKILNKFKNIGVTNLYRFEEEYYTTGNEAKGRIDSVFVSENGTDIYLIELKVNDNVIGGTNGIHKHLIDIENLYYNDEIDGFIDDLKELVDDRRLELKEKSIEWKNDINIHFWTIIACEDEVMKNKIKDDYLDKYNIVDSEEIKKVRNAIKEKNMEYENRVLTLGDHKNNLSKCDVRFYFDYIKYDKKNKIISLTDNSFIKY